MGRKKIWTIAAAVVAVCLIGVGVLVWMQRDDEEKKGPEDVTRDGAAEGTPLEAMYVPYGKDNYIMVDQKNQTVFTVQMPEEIIGQDGSRITQEDLEKGNILTIYGNGIMLESYPGQYPGVSKIEVKETGNPSDADQYQAVIDEIYQEPDPSEPPFLDLEYRTDMAVAAVMTTRGGYKWSYVDGNGETQSVVTDSDHIMASKDIVDVRIEDPVDIKLLFSEEPESVKAVRWPSELRGGQEDISNLPEGENILVEKDGETPVLKSVEAGYVYLITAEWENGTVDYGFYTE